MRKIIHHLRSQPEEIKRHILHFLTVIVAIVLLSFWVYSLQTDFNIPEASTKVANDLKPLSALKGNLIGGYNSISNPDPDLTLPE